MKIESAKTQGEGQSLDSFNNGDCIRLVDNGLSELFLDSVYIVGTSGEGRLAINLLDGCHRREGGFVLEPNAKVVTG